MMSVNESTELLRKRVYFAARDGLPITLYALLSERSLQEQKDLLSQVLLPIPSVSSLLYVLHSEH